MKKILCLVLLAIVMCATLCSCEFDLFSNDEGKDHSPLPCADTDGDNKCDVCKKEITSTPPQTQTPGSGPSQGTTPPQNPDSPSIYNGYYITFNCNGGSVLNSVFAQEGDNVMSAAPTTQKAGYEFQGWYSSPNFIESSRITFPYTITSSQTWYAKWGAIANHQDFHSSISWSAMTVFDMKADTALGVGKIITVPAGVETIHLIGNYDIDAAHIFTNLSFVVQPGGGTVQFVLENFAFVAGEGQAAISANGVNIVITSKGASNMIKGGTGANGGFGGNGNNHASSPSSGSAGAQGSNGSSAVVCRNLRISGTASIKFIGGNGGHGGDGGRGGNINSTSYTGVPTCGHGGSGGSGGNGASGVTVSELNVDGSQVNFYAGNGGNGGVGGNGGNGTYDFIHFCNGGNGGRGGNGGNANSPVSAQTDVSSAPYFSFQGTAGNGGYGGRAGKGNGNNYWSSVDDKYGTNGSNGSNGSVGH